MKKRHRLAAVFLTMILLLQVLSVNTIVVSAVEAPPTNAIPINSVYELSMICNEYPADGYYYLTTDLDMTEELGEYGDFYNDGMGWEPIGTASLPFSGTFDGQGYKISGININRDADFVGLFGYTNNAEIKNLELYNCNIQGKKFVGGMVGYGIGTSIIDCQVSGSVSASAGNCGGIAGELANTESNVLSGCTNNATVTAPTSVVGGLFGKVSGTSVSIENCKNTGNVTGLDGYVAGIVANGTDVDVFDCENSGDISSSKGVSANRVGGIAGIANNVSGCINRGNIVATIRDTYEVTIYNGYAGGVAGVAKTVTECFNAGDVQVRGGEYAYKGSVSTPTGGYLKTFYKQYYTYGGGIAAQITGSGISRCYNMGNITGEYNTVVGAISYFTSITDCYNDSSTTIPLIGKDAAVEVTNCYNTNGTIASKGTATNCYYYADAASGVGELRTLRQLKAKNTFVDWDFENVWTMDGNEDYLYPEFISLPSEFEKTLTSISIGKLPDKTTYIEGKDNLDLTGALLNLNYDNGTVEKIDITDDMVSGFDNTVIGSKNLTVSYGGFTTSFPVTILLKSLVSIEVTQLPDKLQYLECKDNLDLTGGVITLYYNNDTTATLALSKATVSGFDNKVVGEQEIKVSYSGKTTTFTVEVTPKSLESIYVSKNPTKTTYLEGKDTLNLTGGKITLCYDNGQTETISMSEAMVLGFNNRKVGQQTLTVYYKDFETQFTVEVVAKSVSYITIAKQPNVVVYLEGKDTLDVTGGQIRVKYNNDTEEVIDLSQAMVTGFDNALVGNQTVKVSYGGKTTYYEVEVVAKQLVDVTLNDLPAKLTYREGKDTLDVTGGRLKLTYNNETSEYINITSDMVSGFNNTKVGKQTLVVTYADKSVFYDVEIIAKSVVAISVVTKPSKLEYLEVKETLDTSNGRIVVYYDNDTTEYVDITADMITGFDNTKVGKQTLTVTYSNKKTSYDVEIIAKTLTSVAVTTLPEKLAYLEAKDELDVTGGRLTLYYNNDSIDVIRFSTEDVTGFDNTKVGKQTLTVNYGSKKADFEIEVIAKSLTSIAVTTLPSKLTYIELKDELDVTGGNLTLYYDNDTTEVIDLSENMVTGFDNTEVGKKTLTVTYYGKVTSFDVEVIAKSLVSIAVTKLPEKTAYLEVKDELDVTGGKLTLYYDNDTTEDVELSKDMVTGFDNTKTGMQVLTVLYNGKTTTYDVEVVAKKLVSVSVTTLPTKLTYLEAKDELDVTDGRLTLYFDNDTIDVIRFTSSDVTGFDNNKVGKQILTVNHGGKKADFEIEIIAKTLTSIALTSLPEKLTYIEAKDELDLTGGKLTLYYDNDTSEIIDLSDDMVTGFDNAKLGEQTLVVEYKGFTTNFVVTVEKFEEITFLLGDANGDGKVNVKDATHIQKAVADLLVLDEIGALAADVDGNGKVNVKDATAIQKWVADIETGLPIGEKKAV